MPEGDTVRRTARRLDDALAGRLLRRAELRVPRHARAVLQGMAVLGTEPRGKHLLTRLDSGLTLHTHLGMDGAWRTGGVDQPWRGGRGHEARELLENDVSRAIGFRLRRTDLLRTSEEGRVVGHLGPDILAEHLDVDVILRSVAAAPSATISEVLLDQRIVAGIGNIYRLEACFLEGVHPDVLAADVDVARVLETSRQLMLANLGPGERTTTGDRRPSRRYWVYRRARQPCRRCGSTIQTSRSQERITFWCPRCQPATT